MKWPRAVVVGAGVLLELDWAAREDSGATQEGTREIEGAAARCGVGVGGLALRFREPGQSPEAEAVAAAAAAAVGVAGLGWARFDTVRFVDGCEELSSCLAVVGCLKRSLSRFWCPSLLSRATPPSSTKGHKPGALARNCGQAPSALLSTMAYSLIMMGVSCCVKSKT